MAIGGRVGADGSPGLTWPLLTSAPSLPFTFCPPDDGTIEEFAIVWLVMMSVDMIAHGWLLPIG